METNLLSPLGWAPKKYKTLHPYRNGL